MYIQCESFNEWLKTANNVKGISPGGLARDFGVSRQTVNTWVNNNIIDAYSYEGREGKYVIIDMAQYKNIRSFRNR